MSSEATVLYVDDEEECLDLMRNSFEQDAPEMRILTRPDATSALATLSVEAVDVVISDSVALPDGTPFVEAARNEHPALPIVLYSGRDFSELLHTAARARVADYLQKGAKHSPVDLVSRIKTLLGDSAEAAPPSEALSDNGSTTDDDQPDPHDTTTDFWKVPAQEPTWTELARCDPRSETDLLVTLVDALGYRADERPFAHTVDPEALAALFNATSPSTGLRVQLTLSEWDLVISDDGVIMGRPLTLV